MFSQGRADVECVIRFYIDPAEEARGSSYDSGGTWLDGNLRIYKGAGVGAALT